MILKNERKLIICPYCEGYRKIRESTRHGPMMQVNEYTCPTCQGEGQIWQLTKIELEVYKPNNQFKQL